MDYAATAHQYMEDVLAGRILACRWVRLACERQKRDLARTDWDYRFDAERGERVCSFIEALPHVKGRYTGTIELQPWQVFVTMTVFSWVDADGFRRFRVSYIECPRKNGKSSWSSGIALYMLSADGEPGAEVVSAATTRDQAKIVFGDAQQMVRKTRDLREALGVEAGAHAVWQKDSGSSFKALSRDQDGNLDGLNVHCAIVDELHGHKDRGVWDVLDTATGARKQPIIWAITTAGSNRAGICFEQQTYVRRLLDGKHTDETYFGIIWTCDEGDDPFLETTWAKANPNYGVSVQPDDLARKANKARSMASATNNFLTKHLNVWVNADTAWMDMVAWGKAADESLDPADFEDVPCVIAADLASRTDICSTARLHFREVDGLRHYYAFLRHHLPEDAVEGERNSQYAGWALDGLLTVHDGAETDFSEIESDIREQASRYTPRSIGFDPWQAKQMKQDLAKDGLPAVELPQTAKNLSEPMKEFEAAVLAGRFHHDGDPVLTWMVSNVMAHVGYNDNITPRKERAENKIDGAVAIMMALSLITRLGAEREPEYKMFVLGGTQ